MRRLFSPASEVILKLIIDAIKSVDVTKDGRWVLATCDRYLILIPTTCKGEQTGFDVQMGKEKPRPRILKMKTNDIAKHNLSNISFTPARFNVNKEDGETNIITSLGDYVINWNFNKVKKGILDDYKIRKLNQTIVDNQFKFNKNQIVVTMDHKLRIQNQKMLFNQ
jgi:hypothetical protein